MGPETSYGVGFTLACAVEPVSWVRQSQITLLSWRRFSGRPDRGRSATPSRFSKSYPNLESHVRCRNTEMPCNTGDGPPSLQHTCIPYAQARSIGDNYGIAILKVASCCSDPNADIEPPCSFGVKNAKTPFTPKPNKWPSQLRNPQQIFIFMALTVLRWVVGQIITWEQNFWTSLISLCPVYTVCQSDYVWSTADHPISQELQA